MDIQQQGQVVLQKKIENYVYNLNDKIGSGSFSVVFKGINLNNNCTTVAIKKIRISQMKSKIAKRLLDCQITIHKMIRHPNIVECQDVFCSVNNCYLVTQYCNGGNLDQKLKNSKKIHEHQLKKIIYFIYKGLQYLNSLNIIHRDIKVSNILIHNDQYKIADFGFAIRANVPFKDISIGSPVYMSPEGLINNIYGPKTDVWAFGLLIYELIHGKTPLQSCRTEQQLRQKVLVAPKISSKIPSDLKQLIENCLRINMNERLSIQQIGKTSYLMKLSSQFQNLTKKDLTETKSTISSNLSQSSHQKVQMNHAVSISLLNYCGLLHKLNKHQEKICFKKCVSWIASFLSKQHNQECFEPQQIIYKDICERIHQFINKYGISSNPNFDFGQIFEECKKMQFQQKYGRFYGLLIIQTQYLVKALKTGNLDLYAKQSRTKQYINSLIL